MGCGSLFNTQTGLAQVKMLCNLCLDWQCMISVHSSISDLVRQQKPDNIIQ